MDVKRDGHSLGLKLKIGFPLKKLSYNLYMGPFSITTET